MNVAKSWLRPAAMSLLGTALIAFGPVTASGPAPADAAAATARLPAPPASGTMGFVIDNFAQAIVPGKDACPEGPVLKLRDAYIHGLPPTERERLLRKENEKELDRLWQLTAFGPDNTNVCSQPDAFDPPMLRTVRSKLAWGIDLDGDGGKGAAGESGCAQPDFVSPTGQKGIDNQEYRALGCMLEWRNAEGMPSDQAVGMRQFIASGEWTQVILLHGVDSLVRDDDVTVILGNTPDRPIADSKGNFLRGATFTISEQLPRHRNVLKGRIVDGVLSTAPADIKLTQTWGQGGARDLRGERSLWEYRQGQLRVEFHSDGTLSGVLGGYRPIFDPIISPALGGAGSAIVAGIDCSAALKTIRKLADGLRDPKTGQCQGISSAQQLHAVPAFVNDAPTAKRSAAR